MERYRSNYNQIKEETENLNIKKARLENIIDSFQNNNETYAKVKQMIKQEIESIISIPRRLLQFALLSIFESSRKHPGKLQAMYYNMPTLGIVRRSSSTNAIVDSHEQYLSEYTNEYDTWEKLLLDEAEQLYNRMIEESINMYTINEMINNTESSTHSLPPLTELLGVHNGQVRK